MMREMLRPTCVSKDSSSAAMIACRRLGEIWSYETMMRRSVANSPTTSPPRAYTRVIVFGL